MCGGVVVGVGVHTSVGVCGFSVYLCVCVRVRVRACVRVFNKFIKSMNILSCHPL